MTFTQFFSDEKLSMPRSNTWIFITFPPKLIIVSIYHFISHTWLVFRIIRFIWRWYSRVNIEDLRLFDTATVWVDKLDEISKIFSSELCHLPLTQMSYFMEEMKLLEEVTFYTNHPWYKYVHDIKLTSMKYEKVFKGGHLDCNFKSN